MGYMDEYRWAFGIDDVLQTLSYHGPVVVGISWYASMIKPHPSGLLDVAPGGGGGHAILVRGLSLKSRLKGESPKLGPVVRLRNSWGQDWGRDGDCFIKVEDFERLLEARGDCCVPVKRARLPKPDPKAAAEVEDIETLPSIVPPVPTVPTASARP